MKQRIVSEPSFERALSSWPEMGQQVTFLGLTHCPTKFQIYWNGAISCFLGWDCFGNIFPTQKNLTERYQDDQLHLTFGFSNPLKFNLNDRGAVNQSLYNNHFPIVITCWEDNGFRYTITTFATALNPKEINSIPEQTLLLARVTVERINKTTNNSAYLWLNFSGYKCLIWPKEQLEDKFPTYSRKLFLEKNFIYDENNQLRARIIAENPASLTFYDQYPSEKITSPELHLADQKGLLTNLLGLKLPFGNQQKISVILTLPYFPIETKFKTWLNRDFNFELEKTLVYWKKEYAYDTKIITPELLVNNVYQSGLHRIYITTDTDKTTGTLYAKSSPAWYETIWANLAIMTAIALDYRGHHNEAEQYLEPFLNWQGVIEPPNMNGALKEGFFAPPIEYSAIPWVSNHGWTLWGLAEHYKITHDKPWLDRIVPQLIAGCDWIVRERNRTKVLLSSGGKPAGDGLLPSGTVSDDKGQGQYVSTDAHCYRGLKAVADILLDIKHPEADRLIQEAEAYRADIRDAIERAITNSEKVKLHNEDKIPYVPTEIHQTKPPEFNPDDFWPYINYVDTGPLYLADANILDSDSEIINWILRFEKEYPVTELKNEISVDENWCFSIKEPGTVPAYLLRHGISVIEPFYTPQSTVYFNRDETENYLEIFYNQLAAAISHRTLTPIENRFGVWNLPWADAEYLKMLRRMLVQEKGNELQLLNAIPRLWLADNKSTQVQNLPTYFGQISFTVHSKISSGKIRLTLNPPLRNPPELIAIRLRHPLKKEIRQVALNKKDWKDFTAEHIVLKNVKEKVLKLEIRY